MGGGPGALGSCSPMNPATLPPPRSGLGRLLPHPSRGSNEDCLDPPARPASRKPARGGCWCLSRPYRRPLQAVGATAGPGGSTTGPLLLQLLPGPRCSGPNQRYRAGRRNTNRYRKRQLDLSKGCGEGVRLSLSLFCCFYTTDDERPFCRAHLHIGAWDPDKA